jgi:hypothetical protein
LAAHLSQWITVASRSIVAISIGRWHCGSKTSSVLALAEPQQRQVFAVELHQEIARCLRRRQLVTQLQRQRLVLAGLIQVFSALTSRRPHIQQAFHHF